MKVKARSIVGKTLVGTIIWISGVAIFDVVIFLICGGCEFTVSVISISVIGLGLKVLSLLYIAVLALADRDVDTTAAEQPGGKRESVPPEEPMANHQVQEQGTDGSLICQSQKSNDSSLGLGLFLLLLLGIVIGAIGIVNLRKDIRVFSETWRVKSQGREALGTVVVSERKYGYAGAKKRQYIYYLHTVRYDSFQKTFQGIRQMPVGAAVPVLYLEEDPDTAIIGDPTQAASDFRKNRLWDIFGLGFSVVIYSVLAVAGSGLFVVVVVRGVPIILHRHAC